MNDLISRQAAIDALSKAMPSLTTPDGCEQFDREIYVAQETFVDAMQIIHDMPSAEPERKRGQWIYKDGARGFGLGAWCCSECGEENESLPFHKCRNPYEYAASKYCACCGAKMEVEHETD